MKGFDLTIRIAGNTAAPTLSAIRNKGYEIRHSATTLNDDIGDCLYEYNAMKDSRFFSATSPEELLGLIAMWEVRGDDWRGKREDFEFQDELDRKMAIYGEDVNIIESTNINR